jgi:hypothetical protein
LPSFECLLILNSFTVLPPVHPAAHEQGPDHAGDDRASQGSGVAGEVVEQKSETDEDNAADEGANPKRLTSETIHVVLPLQRKGYPSVLEAGTRARDQPAPPHVVFEALTKPNRDPSRQWLLLLEDELAPVVLEAGAPTRVVWSSLWPSRPDARVHFELRPGSGTDLRWTLFVEEPLPDSSKLGHMHKRINELINANLRFSFGQ